GRFGWPGGARIPLPPASDECVELSEAGGVFRNSQFRDPQPDGACAILGELIDARLQRQVRGMTPQMNVVINHAIIFAPMNAGTGLPGRCHPGAGGSARIEAVGPPTRPGTGDWGWRRQEATAAGTR